MTGVQTCALPILYSKTITNPGNFSGASNILYQNREFIQAEVIAYINQRYTTAISAASSTGNKFTGSTTYLNSGMSVKFNGTVGGVTAGTTYYVKDVLDATHFTISETVGGAVKTLSDLVGSMTLSFSYDQTLCQRDVGYTVDALAMDLKIGRAHV